MHIYSLKTVYHIKKQLHSTKLSRTAGMRDKRYSEIAPLNHKGKNDV